MFFYVYRLFLKFICLRHAKLSLPLDKVIAHRAVFVIVSIVPGLDERAEMLLEPAK